MCVCLVGDLGRDCMGSVGWDGVMKLGAGRAESVCMFVLFFRGWVGCPVCDKDKLMNVCVVNFYFVFVRSVT